jgi:hypothetical protein
MELLQDDLQIIPSINYRECKWGLQSDIDAETVKEWHFEIPRTLLAKTLGIV